MTENQRLKRRERNRKYRKSNSQKQKRLAKALLKRSVRQDDIKCFKDLLAPFDTSWLDKDKINNNTNDDDAVADLKREFDKNTEKILNYVKTVENDKFNIFVKEEKEKEEEYIKIHKEFDRNTKIILDHILKHEKKNLTEHQLKMIIIL